MDELHTFLFIITIHTCSNNDGVNFLDKNNIIIKYELTVLALELSKFFEKYCKHWRNPLKFLEED